MELGEYIRSVRKKKNLSLRETAKRAQVSNSYLSQIENGHNANPNKEILLRLSEVLEVNYMRDLVIKTKYYKSIVDEYVEKETDRLMENYEYVREIRGTNLYDEYTFELEMLLSENTALTFHGKELSNNDKEKLYSIIKTILD